MNYKAMAKLALMADTRAFLIRRASTIAALTVTDGLTHQEATDIVDEVISELNEIFSPMIKNAESELGVLK